jgi:hypothetical protein
LLCADSPESLNVIRLCLQYLASARLLY